MNNDITSRNDIETLVTCFYEKVKNDTLLAPHFHHLNWPEHLPIMFDFWSSILLGDQSYRRNPMEKHLPLPIETEHFDRWLALFSETLEENFSGPKADEARSRAHNIAGIFKLKMGLVPGFSGAK
ncbi:MAG: group III truncated hemoglobin [Bacteroidota bacterium]